MAESEIIPQNTDGADGSVSSAPTEGAASPPAAAAGPDESSAPTIPETYTFTLPEGVEADKALTEGMQSAFKELNLTQEQAQKLTDIYAERFVTLGAEHEQMMNAQLEEWRQEVQKDPRLGGSNFERTKELSGEFMQWYEQEHGTDDATEFRQMVETLGVGDNKHWLRMATALGAGIQEAKSAQAGGSNQPQDIKSILYSGNK